MNRSPDVGIRDLPTIATLSRVGPLLIFATLALTACQPTGDSKSPVEGPRTSKGKSQVDRPKDVSVDADLPVPFGYKLWWLAFRSETAEPVLARLELKDSRRCGWKAGIDAAYEGDVFVTPSINGWVLAAGMGMPDDPGKFRTFIESLSKGFPEVQCFATHRVVGYAAWAKVLDGKLVRHYAFVGDRGETVCNFGELTREEKALGLIFNQMDSPGEEDVMKLAGAWSIDPSRLDQLNLGKSTGYLGSRD
jgi:hypothetical protein